MSKRGRDGCLCMRGSQGGLGPQDRLKRGTAVRGSGWKAPVSLPPAAFAPVLGCCEVDVSSR